MKHKKISKKAHSVGSVLVSVALVISIFSIGFYTEGNNSIVKNDKNQITGNAVGMEGVTGFANAVFVWEEKGVTKTDSSRPENIDYRKRFEGVPNEKDRVEYYKTGANEPHNTLYKNPRTGLFESSSPVVSGKNRYQGLYDGKWYDLPEQYSSTIEATD